ncbi:MAG: hypothetical protein HOE80_02615 [Candidatus Magasanikbacteria bacterium]|jgi:tyrosine-specific transport protein|nr:hypothetical protein [Candidatus Magasanikbacteria bacterium]MBT4071594.1 hypothetical protein [Candidatus Magasanikbacteria bacterium]
MFRHKHIQASEHPLVKHRGIFHRELSLWQAVALIVSGTIGAGVLGIPYAVAKVGLIPGIIYIIVLGLLMMGLNLLLADITNYTTKNAQLTGLAEKYLGKKAKWLMTVLFYSTLVGAQVIYLIGEGDALTAMLGGSPFLWSIVFFSVTTFIILLGLKGIKTIEFVLMFCILFVVLLIAGWAAPYMSTESLGFINMSAILFPYGVILFAFHGTNAIPEARLLLKNKPKLFRKSVILAAAIVIITYTLFACIVVSVTGVHTTEIATIGLGEKIGPIMILFGNIFAVLAMATSYLLIGLSMRDALHWDFRVSKTLATTLTISVPLLIFLAGATHFIRVMDFVGGVFVSLEGILLLFIYLEVLKKMRLKVGRRLWFVILLFIVFSFGAIYSIAELFL